MATWVNVDAEFGAPWKTFAIDLRSELGRKFLREYAAIPESQAEFRASFIARFITNIRPELKGVEVIGISGKNYAWRVYFDCIHPSFQRAVSGMMPEPEMLEKCPICDRPMPYSGERFVRVIGDRAEYVCSQECVGPLVIYGSKE